MTRGAFRDVADRILRELARPYPVEGRDLHVSVSIDIALCPSDGHLPDELLKLADEALYRAKLKRNHTEFYADPTVPSGIYGEASRLLATIVLVHAAKP